MIRWTLAFLLTAAFAVTSVGCGGDTPAPTPQESPTEPGSPPEGEPGS